MSDSSPPSPARSLGPPSTSSTVQVLATIADVSNPLVTSPTQAVPAPPSSALAMPTPSTPPATTTLSSTIMPLLSVGVATMSVSTNLPPSSSTFPISTPIVLPSVMPTPSSHPSVSLDHVYTSRDTNSMWSMGYRPEQRTLTIFVSPFDQNLIRSIGVQNSTDFAKVFLQRSLEILEKNGQRHKEALNKVTSLEAEVTKWRATTWIVWRVKCPKVANAIVALAEAIKSNHRLSSKVSNVLANLLHIRVDGD